jgi:hypothetical protein
MPVTRAALDVTSRAALRAIVAARPAAQAVDNPAPVSEQTALSDPPVLASAEGLEPGAPRSIPVAGSAVGFAAFLDGTQRARILAWLNGVPYVLGTVAAAIRRRVDRRLITWDGLAPAVEHRLYLPLTYVGDIAPQLGDFHVVDTAAPHLGEKIPSQHPAALLDRALQCVQADRERLEQRFAAAWVEAAGGVLCIDGPLPPAGAARSSELAVGLVKSHRTLYATGADLHAILALRACERSPAFAVVAGGREPVASWYVRTRDNGGKDALWGLVRIECAMSDRITLRADTVSRWLLAESAPLALPDPRWDKMTYGVRDTEQFLRAIS